MQGNNATEAGAVALAFALDQLQDLQAFLFVGNRPGLEGTRSLVSALVKCPALQVRFPAVLASPCHMVLSGA